MTTAEITLTVLLVVCIFWSVKREQDVRQLRRRILWLHSQRLPTFINGALCFAIAQALLRRWMNR